jgi:hypothetical protein
MSNAYPVAPSVDWVVQEARPANGFAFSVPDYSSYSDSANRDAFEQEGELFASALLAHHSAVISIAEKM